MLKKSFLIPGDRPQVAVFKCRNLRSNYNVMKFENKMDIKVFTLGLMIFALGLSDKLHAELFEYEITGSIQLLDLTISCGNSDQAESDEYIFSAVMYGDTSTIQRTAITGFGELETIDLLDGSLIIDGLGDFRLDQARIRSLNQTGLLGFSWGGTETGIGSLVIFYGTSRLLDEAAINDSVYFDSINSINPIITLSNQRAYKILNSNNTTYTSQPISEIPDLGLDDTPVDENPCIDGNINPVPTPNPVPISPINPEIGLDSNGGGSFNLVTLLLLFLVLYFRYIFHNKYRQLDKHSAAASCLPLL